MKLSGALLALGVLALALPSLTAEEPPHLEFVRGLRGRGMADLALEYLQSKSKNPPPELAAILPLELAKTRLELATTKLDAASRLAVQNQAKAEFEQFVRNNPKHPLAAEANLEIARIEAFQGKALYSRARREEVKEQQQAEMVRARSQFEKAAAQLQAAAAQIDAQLAGSGGQATSQAEAEKQSLTQARLQAELELGINLLEQAQTFTEQSEAAKRAELFKKAIDLLGKLSKRDSKSPICWQALAWLGRCYQENEDPKTARKVYAELIAEGAEEADAGRRLARFFRLQTLLGEGDPKKAVADIRKAGEEWLIIYPNYLNTPEGYGVRFELANAYLKQALAAKQSPQARSLHEEAQKLFKSLEQTENDYSTSARELRLQSLLLSLQERFGDLRKPERFGEALRKLKDFEECNLLAQFEMALMHDDAKKFKGDELEDVRKQHFAKILDALNRGLDLADSKTPIEDVNDARYLLTYAYLTTGEYYRAAVSGEDLARTQGRFLHAAMAGAYALQSYAAILGQQEEAGASKEDAEPVRNRLRELARYVEQNWPQDGAADIARHLLGWVLVSEKNYPEAVDVLERVTPEYPDLTRAMFQLAEAAFQAQKEEASKPVPGKRSYQDRALAGLQRIGEGNPKGDPGTVNAYIASKLILAGIYYTTKQFDKMEALTEALQKFVEEVDPKIKAEQRLPVLVRALYAKLGRAEVEFNAGHYAKTRELLDPLVNQLRDQAHADQLKEKDPQLLRAVLGLDLRASVQDHQMDRGREILDLLQKIFPDNSLDILVQLVKQLNAQIQHLRGQGAAAGEQLDRTIKSFSDFLDVLAKQQEMTPKPELLLFLAQSYSTLDNHGRAAELASKIAEPKVEDGKKEADLKATQLYHLGRILYLRELRLNGEFDKAESLLKEILGSNGASTISRPRRNGSLS
jgi:tetratricopeptide (TPR) repeat protein